MAHKWLHHPAAPGVLLVLSALLAITIANSPLSPFYNMLLDTPVAIQIGTFAIDKPMLLWVNDGLMAIFFFMVGLELKREFLEGGLRERDQRMLPLLGAAGGMFVPAGIYAALNWHNPQAINGWAIPAATDIAFALGVLSLLGTRVPLALKVFLVSLAIFDDIGAIVIIAMFYTDNISATALITASICLTILFGMNRADFYHRSAFFTVGLVMWASLLKSGVHATLAGALLALFIPMRHPEDQHYSPAKTIEHELHGLVNFLILPVFAFCNAGLTFSGMGLDSLLHPISLGILLGLFVGKQLGVFAFCWVGVKLGIAKLPHEFGWSSLYGVALLCGIGFTMSLFIGSLAFEQSGINQAVDERLGILVGSLLSGIAGYLVLNKTLKIRV